MKAAEHENQLGQVAAVRSPAVEVAGPFVGVFPPEESGKASDELELIVRAS